MAQAELTSADQHLLKRCEEFYADINLDGFWAENTVLPQGIFVATDPRDMPPMLWHGDLQRDKADDIIAAVEAHAAQQGHAPGFALSPSWGRGLDRFRDMIAGRGYTRQQAYICYVFDLRNYTPPEANPDVSVKQTVDMDGFADLMADVFAPVLGEIIRAGAAREPDAPHRRFFLARNARGEIMGGAGITFKGDMAYLNCLGVRPAFRGRNVAGTLISNRLAFLAQNGAKECFTLVEVRNETSQRVMERAGYRKLAQIEYWSKGAPDAAQGAGIGI